MWNLPHTCLAALGLTVLSLVSGHVVPQVRSEQGAKDTKVLVLGGGVAGVIAARTLHEQGIDDFIIVEAREELGGRMHSVRFGAPGREVVLELGPNWIQGTQTGNGPKNPILTLAEKHNLSKYPSNFDDITTYDVSGAANYLEVMANADIAYENLLVAAGERVSKQLVDATARTGYSLLGSKPRTAEEKAAEWYIFDWGNAQTPEETSWIASSWSENYTTHGDAGGFSDDNIMSIDQRGFKWLIQDEAHSFVNNSQLMLNWTVKTIAYSDSGVNVTLTDGRVLAADYVVCTFSLGVLQNDDVKFEPVLPMWKQEAIQSMTMGTYTKIFLQFPYKFWFNTQMGIYADIDRGKYPLWQSLDHDGFFPGSGVLLVTVTGDFSLRIEALPDAKVKDEVMGVVRNMFPNVTVPDPDAFYFYRWNSDPLFRGSFSSWPPSFFSEHHDNLRATVEKRLWFAGEAMSQKYFGFLHGAYFEGLAIGEEVAKCVKAGGCEGLEHYEEVKNARPYKI